MRSLDLSLESIKGGAESGTEHFVEPWRAAEDEERGEFGARIDSISFSFSFSVPGVRKVRWASTGCNRYSIIVWSPAEQSEADLWGRGRGRGRGKGGMMPAHKSVTSNRRDRP